MFSLALATIIRIFFVILSYGCKVPAGIFVPSMAIGATFGRMVGIFVQAIHESFPDSKFFASCAPDVPCITPGTYAFLGAGAALSGIMHITVSVVVIMFELTGALTYILPTMIVVGVTKAISEQLSKGGIADRMIGFNGFPFLDTKEEHSFGVPVSTAMTSNITCFPAIGLELSDLHRVLSENKYQGYPIVEDLTSKTLIGYIGRTELLYAINRMQREQRIAPNAKCFFTLPNSRSNSTPVSALGPAVTFDTMSATAGRASIDFSRFIDATPISVHPRLPLETVMEVFKKMGPRVILIEHRGKLTGLVTVKDCLKYQFKVEAQENPKDDTELDEREEWVWNVISRIAIWIQKKRQGIPWQGTLRLGETDDGRTSATERSSDSLASPQDQVAPRRAYSQAEVELENI
jgi:chloride channel 3/4/5